MERIWVGGVVDEERDIYLAKEKKKRSKRKS